MPGYAILLIMIGFVVLWLASMIAFGVWFFRRTKRRIAQQYPELHSSQLVAEAGQQHRATLLRTVTFWLLLILSACLAVPLVIHYGFKKPVGETLILTWRLLWPAFWTCMGLVALVGIVRYAVDRARRGAVIIDLHKDNRIRSARKAMCFYPFMAAL